MALIYIKIINLFNLLYTLLKSLFIMSNIFGNMNQGGGFANPATGQLDMNQYKIFDLPNGTNPSDAVNLSQLTTYNPFNQSLNTTDNVRFAGVNMNGAWQIPSSQPSSPNDVNTYNLSARGGLINITTDPNQSVGKIIISLQLNPTGTYPVAIPIPNGYIAYADLGDYIKNYFNSLTINGTVNVVQCALCEFQAGVFKIIIVNSQANVGPWSNVYTLNSGYSGSVSYILGITMADTKIYTQTASGTVAVNYVSTVGWFSGNSAYPIQNGSPYIYSTAQDKWYTNEALYNSTFQSYFDIATTGDYRVVQNASGGAGDVKFIISESSIGSQLWGPVSSGSALLINADITLRVNNIGRMAINSANTFIYSPNTSNMFRVNNLWLSMMYNSTHRVLVDNSLTSIYSPNTDNYVNVSDGGLSYTQGGVVRISSTAGSTYLSASNVITNCSVSTSGVVLNVDTVPRFSALSAGATTIKSYDDTMTLTLASNSLTASTSIPRLIIDTVKSQLFSPDGLYSLYSSNSGASLVYNGTARLGVSASQTISYSPDYASSSAMTNTDITMLQGGFTKFVMNENALIGTSLWGPSGSGRIELLTARINLRQNSVNRFVINNAETFSYSPSLLNYSYKSDTEVASFFNSVNRFSIGSTSCVLRSPSSTNYITVDDTGLTYTQGGVGRISSTAASTYLLAANGSTNCSVSNTGTVINVDFVGRFRALSGGGTEIKSYESTASCTLLPDNFTAATSTNSLVINADFNYFKGAQLRIHADSSHSQLLSPDGTKAVEANNTGVQINLGANNFLLPITRGTVGQVITASGIAGTPSTWATPSGITGITNGGTGNTLLASTTSTKGLIAGSGISLTASGTDITIASSGTAYNAGFSLFSPLLSNATILSSSKAYWYIVMVPFNTTLNGFKTILSAGSDPFHIAIYRGRTINSATTVLDLLSPITTAVGGGFYTGAFAVQAGRNNTYASGEYITVMYHSQGSTNVFYNTVSTIADLNFSYTSSANYGNAAPPANLGSVPSLATNVNRLAIEFY